MMTSVMAQTNIRYVKPAGSGPTDGKYANDGKSWNSPKANIQDAINDLVDNGLTGEVWVAAGTYTPTESTESSGGSTLYMAFKIPAGITVRGGFAGTEATAAAREKKPHNLMGDVYTNKTILSGKLAATATKFEWSDEKQKFETKFYGNTYHVVWFAMNGFDASGRANPLTHAAELEGCVIQEGHANNSNLAGHPHNAYGGGVYMVANAVVRNCEVQHCDASRDGGGIYMDGGGHIEHTYIHDCQTLGTGVENGFGGGVCIDGGSTPDLGVISRSAVCNNVGRLGGGLSIKISNPAYQYNMAASTTLVSNNTSIASGGGVFLYKGGAIADLSILANRCNGSGNIVNDIQTGRAGGLFVHDHAKVANTVMWGNTCAANRDVQYASSRQNSSIEKVDMKFCALSNADYCDWNNTKKHRVLSLSTDNTGNASHNQEQGFPIFKSIPTAALTDKFPVSGHLNDTQLASVDWQVTSESALHHAGIQTIDLDEQGKTDSPELTVDVKGENFNPRVTLGAYVSAAANITPQIDGENVNFYVDPNYVFGEHSAEAKGNSWTLPTRFLANVLELVKQDAEKADAERQWKNKTINIYVKEGTINNTDSYRTGRVREMAIEVPSNVNIYGGYAASLTGTNLSVRNPRIYQTVITGEIMGNFNTNVAHLVKLTNVHDVLIDGVQIRDANAWSTAISTVNQNGAAVTIKSSTNVKFQNVLIANNLAAQGTAVYADGNSVVEFENCIFHNNTSQTKQGIIFADDDAKLTFNHCDVLRNVGHASWLDRNATNKWKNSILFANLSEAVENTNINVAGAHPKALHSFAGTNTNGATGSYCMFDAVSADVQGRFNGNDTKNQWQYNLQYKIGDTEAAGYPRFINPTRNAGHTIGGDVTFYGRAASFEPHNLNPVVNMATTDGVSHEDPNHSATSNSTWGTDMSTVTNRDFGGLPDIGAIENHKDESGSWENAYREGQHPYGSIFYVRDYRDEHGNIDLSKGGDGLSWEHALNGNAIYQYTVDGIDHKLYDSDHSITVVGQNYTGTDAYKETYYPTLEERQYYTIESAASPDITDANAKLLKIIGGNTVKAYSWNGSVNAGSLDIKNSDNYVLVTVDASKNQYRIYNKTRNMYLNYPSSRGNNTNTGLQATTDGNTIWRVVINQVESGSNLQNDTREGYYDIYPDDLGDVNNLTTGSLGLNNGNSLLFWAIGKPNSAWRFSPYDATGPCATDGRDNRNNYTDECDNTSFERNNYTYTSGLQYAVNKARHHLILSGRATSGDAGTKAPVQVWIGAGSYFDAKGYKIQDGVNVFGGFPAVGNPCELERDPSNPANLTTIQVKEVSGDPEASNYYRNVWETEKTLLNNNTRLAYDWYRVLTQPRNSQATTNNDLGWDGLKPDTSDPANAFKQNDEQIKDDAAFRYITKWDGFTIQGGFCSSSQGHEGGGGVLIRTHGQLENCIVQYNMGSNVYGGGLMVRRGDVINCVIRNNFNIYLGQSNKVNGGGLSTSRFATMYNCVVYDNDITEGWLGSQVFMNQAIFFNNTITNTGNAHLGARDFFSLGYVEGSTFINNIIWPNGKYSASQNYTVNLNEANVVIENNLMPNSDVSIPGDNDYVKNNRRSDDAQYVKFTDVANGNFRLLTGSNAINEGLDNPYKYTVDGKFATSFSGATKTTVSLPGEDADYTERVKDCRVDIGAYEYDDVTSIDGEDIGDNTIAYYVTPEGYGTRAANDPANAACAQKLQKVIDAAGRYKYLNPTKKVIVKVANSYALEHDADENSHFQYYATRTTDQGDENVRVWSIMIPRGVEVWGGYTDVARSNQTVASWTNDDNGFKAEDGKDARNIVKNPTYFDSYYKNKLDHSEAYCYHVVTFTDRVFDFEGTPYLKADLTREGSAAALFATRSTYNPASNRDEDDLLHMSDVINTTTDGITNTNLHRAVLDGIFVTGGKADAKGESTSATKNINQYGGAAIVTDYAHVRNCILKGNTAINGGALALKNHAMVSGSLMLENTADNHGGALYVFENGTELSDGTTITAAMDESAQYPDHNLSHVFTTTVVKNTAQVGGGLWFSDNNPNVRVNSSVFWGNTAPDQANVAGEVNPEKPVGNTLSAEAFYPFAYSAIQDVRASGTNNISLSETNVNGARFAGKETDLTERPLPAGDPSDTEFSPYYGIMHYSTLTHAGMPVQNYDLLMAQTAVSATDFTGRSRTATASKAGRKYVEIGARAFDKMLPDKQLMLRLFVARSQDTDINTARELYKAGVGATEGSDAEYYGQEGSSFGYPFQTLYEALEYIKMWRTNSELLTKAHANNLPFEIFISQGTYYPKMDLKGRTDHALAATFAIPEGVSLYGGFKANDFTGTDAVPEKLYGKGYVPKAGAAAAMTDGGNIENNVESVGDDSTASIDLIDADGNPTGETKTIYQTPTLAILAARDHNDNNANSIIEPWEFEHQTILSGDATNDNNNGVYHVVTVVADQNVNGKLPKASRVLKADDVAEDADKYGMDVHFEGQRVRLNGLRIQDGYAFHYVPEAFSDDPTSDYNYYHGGGLLVDGNRFNDHANGRSGSPNDETVYKHKGRTNAVGYRDIPVSISGCQFIDNRGGFGGAVSANTSLEIYESAFMKNQAVGMSESFNHPGHGDVTVEYPGNGGAIHSTYKLSAFNTLFANNEAVNAKYPIDPKYYHTLRNESSSHTGLAIPGGAGGAISVGKAGFFHIANCDFVRNQANMYPAVFTMNPNYEPGDAKDVKMTSDLTKYNQLLNSVFWGNEVNPEMAAKYDASNERFKFASRLVVNYGGKNRNYNENYNSAFNHVGVPSSQSDLDEHFAEAIWFSAYEEGRAITANNTADLRDVVITAAGTGAKHIIKNIADENSNTYQNCNVTIASENNVIEGPNFMNPSKAAGIMGYMDNADWAPARMNKFTDQGSGKLAQTVSIASDGKTYKATFNDVSAATGVYAVSRRYNTEHTNNVPIGDEEYMKQVVGTTTKPMLRISSDPAPGKEKAYIDMGVYEYVHNPLVLNNGDEVDVLWVSTQEKPANGVADGSTWETPTSDLQRAIETLLASRNGHRKEIRLMDGTYTPLYTIEGVSGFYIDTKRLNGSVILPEGATQGQQSEYNVRSFTIKGGYSRDLEGECDATKYPAVIAPQQRMPGNSTRWDHLIYIADATQRYGLVNTTGGAAGLDAYNAENYEGAALGGDASTIKTIPIEIDGVTVINDQVNPLSLAGDKKVQGAAIYYADDPNLDNAGKSKGTYPANVTKTITYYTTGAKTDVSSTPTEFFTIESVRKENPAKLIISKTKILGTGVEGNKNAGAVYIGKGIGHALLYNNVFSSNYGNPLEGWDVTTINNTFALNGGKIVLDNTDGESFKSSIINTAMWLNNYDGGAYGDQFSLPGTLADDKFDIKNNEAIFRNNAFTGGEQISSDQMDAYKHNVGLISTNSHLTDGPNFVNPSATDIMNANYSILASNRLLNKGNNDSYEKSVVAPVSTLALGVPDPIYSECTIYEYAAHPTTDLDAAYLPRFQEDIEIGAYEYQYPLQRVFYVDPSKPSIAENDGTTWEKAMGNGDIKKAVDNAALYHMSHSGDTGDNSAYVFVKGKKDFHSGETVTLRNGVKVFGSMPSGYTNEHSTEDEGEGDTHEKENNQLAAYLKRINNDRAGIAEPNASKTTLAGVDVDADVDFTESTVSLLDGFVISAKSPENPDGKVNAPVLKLTPKSTGSIIPKVAIRNVIVNDNDASEHSGINIAEIDNALIYEVLMRDNKVHATNGAVMKLGTNGWAVNVTVEGKSLGAGANTDEVYNGGEHILSSIVNYGNEPSTKNTLSGYNYELEDKNLNYQLAEKSKHIDECATTVPSSLPANLQVFIDYAHDRDLLGNPRMMYLADNGKTTFIDRGAFETWKVDVEAVTTDEGIASDADTDHNGWSGTHYYPHHGSVVYVMDGKNLISNHELVPGFLLIQQGASLYGNGYDVNAAYVAVERNIKQEGSIVALPYAMKYNSDDAAAPTYDTNGVLTLTGATSKAWNYSGSERSAWDYVFARKDANATSTCWHEIADAASTDAYNGVLYEAKNAEGGRLVRFTAKGNDMADYVYTESGVSKTVELRKYDDAESNNHDASFTNPLDMGWNCFGIPYLVSEYKPYETATTAVHGAENNGKYMMNKPHTLWLYYDGNQAPDGTTTKPTMGDGGYYSVKAWLPYNDSSSPWHVTDASGAAIWVGEGIFTQTATLDDTESLVFYRPIYTAGGGTGAKGIRIYGDPTGIEEVMAEDAKADDVELVGTEYYTTDGMQLREPRRGTIVIIKRIYSNGAVKATKQYVK